MRYATRKVHLIPHGGIMGKTTLREYFQQHGHRRALDAYTRFATGSAWSVCSKMELYDASRTAYDPQTPTEQAFESFQTIYDTLKGYWQVFRTSKRDLDESPWSAKEIFDKIRIEFAGYGWNDPIVLPTFFETGKHHALRFSLMEMRGIKANNDYPTMTVSKFLHFYNPALFPIYDTEVVWKKVFGRFRADYDEFCSSANLAKDANGDAFLRNYMCWGSSLMSSANSSFMADFVDWLQQELPPRQFNATGPVALGRLYATAFEFTAIGAAVAEGY